MKSPFHPQRQDKLVVAWLENIARLEFEDFIDEAMYETMNIDLHNQGMILNRKYTYLNQAYRIFLFGFILSVWVFLAFLVAG